MADRALMRVTEMLAEMKRPATQSVKSGHVVAKFVALQGGEGAIGEKLHERFQQALDDPTISHKEARAWLVNILKLMQRQEQQDVELGAELRDLTEQDLMALLRPACLELLKSDGAFLQEVLDYHGLVAIPAPPIDAEASIA